MVTISTPEPSSEDARRRMRSTRRRDTSAELSLRSAVRRLGLRYRVDVSPLEGSRRRADIVFGRERVAVFVDGCFWHSCPVHGTQPKQNHDWWEAKLEANRRRDESSNRELTEAGWLVMRFWEHEDPDHAAERVAEVVKSRRD